MDFEMVVKRRRMCANYLGRDVPQEKVDRILDLACRYPSAGHTEAQEFIVVRDRQVKENLARAALGQMFVAQAPLVIVVVSDTRRSVRRYEVRGVHRLTDEEVRLVEGLRQQTTSMTDEELAHTLASGLEGRTGSPPARPAAPSWRRSRPARPARPGT